MALSHLMGEVSHELGGHEEKPKKEVREIRTRKAKSGGYIHEHHHTHPEHHPMEEHTSHDQDSMVEHMLKHIGTPNPGEADADAGTPDQYSGPSGSQAPDATAAPTSGAASALPAPSSPSSPTSATPPGM